jgi:release factor glutamine methyltransferase
MSGDLSLRDLLRSSALPQNEARLLLAHTLEQHYQLPRSALLSRDEMELSPSALAFWRELESQRISGQPIAYLIGKKGFHNIELLVAPGVLIPRPETELLVEIGLREIKQLSGKASLLDLGTGSGAIALAIASASPNTLVTATDHSAEALAIALKNTKNLGLEARVQLVQGNWYEAISKEEQFDLILSNPPYIESNDPHLLQGDLRFEPINALTDQADGLSCLRTIISGAQEHLKPSGLIAIEHGFDQSAAVIDLMKSAGLRDIETHLDLAGHHRVASGRK